jgi:hypothetical protein
LGLTFRRVSRAAEYLRLQRGLVPEQIARSVLPAAFPMREGVDPAKASLLVHHVVGYSRSNDEK